MITQLPFEIGSGEAVDLRLTPEEVYERHCAIAKSGKKHWLVKRTPEAVVNLDGDPFEHAAELNANTDYSVMVGYRLYLLRGGNKIEEWLGRINCAEWIIQNADSGEIWGPVAFDQVRQQIELIGRGIDGMVAAVTGAGKGFFLDDIWNLLPEPAVEAEPADSDEMDFDVANGSSTDLAVPDIDEISGEFTCPTCWKHFDRKDILWIARHPSLRGTDPDLGEDIMLRFRAADYDERGHARDPMGVSCGEQACPHCKRRLHPGFMDLQNHIFSIVGAPSAGKSYFLTSAIKRLEESLPKSFGIAFQDADAEGNSTVSLMKARLFSDSSRPDEIYLDKTVPGGEMYEVWERDGRQVRLPKPFTYMVSPFDESGDSEQTEPVNLVFYDNAGEHFEPAERAEVGGGDDELQSTKHLASSAVIFFLFDPTSNSDFRTRLADTEDPQIKDARFTKLDRQNNILSEMRNRIKRELNIAARDKIDTPIAVLVGKCDIWSRLLGDDPFVNPVGRRQIDLGAVQQNSRLIRDFLMDVTPNIVANCEAISREVVYFPVSPLGHSPQSFTRDMGEGREPQTFIGPVPGQVKPIHTEVPILWALSKLNPGLVPPVQPEAVT